MLISPPFLVAQAANQTERDWIAACMPGGRFGDGGFPVSAYLGWHGGLHLDAPMNGNVAEQVRAIADGTIVYTRQPATRPDDPTTTHPQMYRGQWTDNGVVIIRHDTEIGEGANSKVSFFSVYMHLRQLDSTVAIGRSIYRKAVIGDAGHIYGSQNKIHFEIICDDANLARITGRANGNLALTTNGRTDAIYGQMYFHLPAGTPVFAEKPLNNNASAMRQPPTPRGQPKPAAVALQASYTSTEALIVGLRYAHGQGDARNKGSAYLCTFQLDGSVIGPASGDNVTPPSEDTAALIETDAEYKLYTTATQISEAYPAGNRPAPSAVHELLRFGRVIGPDALTPATVPHWREVRYPGGQGWVNLNATNIHKFSDADFPHWKGWKHIADDTNPDCRCDSELLRGLLRNTPNEQLTEAELRARAALPAKYEKLKKTICKFPTEWDSSTIDSRWGWLKTVDANPLSEEDFEVLRAHITAVAFWQAAGPRLVGPPGANNTPGTPLPATHWHFEPREFIRHFRRCGWLNEREFLRCISFKYQTNRTNNSSPIIQSTVTTQSAKQRITNRDAQIFMKICRKYGIQGIRMAHFLAQIYQETGVLQWSQELASGAEYEGRADLGNTTPGDGIRFKGRGLIQTTGRKNYESYSLYRGKLGSQRYTSEPNNLLLSSQPYECSDTAGLYWVSRRVGPAGVNICRIADQGVDENQIRQVTQNVNGAQDGPWTGLVARRSHLKITAHIILDLTNEISPEKARTDA